MLQSEALLEDDMRLEFGGRLDRWLDPPDPELCACGEELAEWGCDEPRCEFYTPEPTGEDEDE
jgi:hypothetical protein